MEIFYFLIGVISGYFIYWLHFNKEVKKIYDEAINNNLRSIENFNKSSEIICDLQKAYKNIIDYENKLKTQRKDVIERNSLN